MADSTIKTTILATTAAAPTIVAQQEVDWGSWASMALVREAHILETLAVAGVNMALELVPFGVFLKLYATPRLIVQYTDLALVALEHVLAPMHFDIQGGTIFATVVSMFSSAEEALFNFLGDAFNKLVAAELTKRGYTLPAAT